MPIGSSIKNHPCGSGGGGDGSAIKEY